MYMTCIHIAVIGAGYSYPHVQYVQYMSIQYLEDYRPCHHHEIYTYRYVLLQDTVPYTPRYKYSDDLLPPSACIHPYVTGRCHSALEVESVHTCTSLCDKETGEPKDD